MTDKKISLQKAKKPEYHKDLLVKHWGSGKALTHEGKKYGVHRMSYGDYFLEPHGKSGGEKEPFHKNTKWLKLKDAKKGTYEAE